MQIFRKLEEVPATDGGTVVTVGNFDGVHCAHQAVLAEVVKRARALEARSLAVTFEPHPMRILRPDAAPRLLTPLEMKLELLARAAVDAVLLLPFTRDLSLTPPEDFAREVLSLGLRAREVQEGENFRFGHRAQGDVRQLADFGRKFGFLVKIYPALRIRGETVSSSRIRELLAEGKVSRVRHLLGRPFAIRAHPGRGRGYGHRYTVPTINLARYDEMVAQDGVYITRTRVGSERFDSVTNVGNRPTFGGDSYAIETHLLKFHPLEVTADTQVEICFLRRLRPEIKFPSIDALRDQIARDVHRARRYFALAGRRVAAARALP